MEGCEVGCFLGWPVGVRERPRLGNCTWGGGEANTFASRSSGFWPSWPVESPSLSFASVFHSYRRPLELLCR